MTHYYSCNMEESKNILSQIGGGVEYEAFIFENRLEIEFVAPQSLLDLECDKYLIESSVGDPITIEFSNGKKQVLINGIFELQDFESLINCFGFTPNYLNFIKSSREYSCPIEIISRKSESNKLFLVLEEIGKNRIVADDW